MLSKHIKKPDVQSRKADLLFPPFAKQNSTQPKPSSHCLNEAVQLHTSHYAQLDHSTLKSQQLLVIENMLDHKLSIFQEINHLFHASHSALWLDNRIEKFKLHCPPTILSMLLLAGTDDRSVPYFNSLNVHFFSLINELLYIPLKTLTALPQQQLSDNERQEWYEWCLQFYKNLADIKLKIRHAQNFFDAKTFDKITQLTKDEYILYQLWNIKNLFQSDHLVES